MSSHESHCSSGRSVCKTHNAHLGIVSCDTSVLQALYSSAPETWAAHLGLSPLVELATVAKHLKCSALQQLAATALWLKCAARDHPSSMLRPPAKTELCSANAASIYSSAGRLGLTGAFLCCHNCKSPVNSGTHSAACASSLQATVCGSVPFERKDAAVSTLLSSSCVACCRAAAGDCQMDGRQRVRGGRQCSRG